MKQYWLIVNQTPGTYFIDIQLEYKFSMKENAFKNVVCKMLTILFTPQCIQLVCVSVIL